MMQVITGQTEDMDEAAMAAFVKPCFALVQKLPTWKQNA